MSTEYIKGTKIGKLYIVVVMLISITIVVLEFSDDSQDNSSNINSSVELNKLKQDERNTALIKTIVFAFFQPVIWFIAYRMFRYSEKVRDLERYPLPNTNVPFDTQIQTGGRARLHARNIRKLAIVIVLSGLCFVVLGVWNYLST